METKAPLRNPKKAFKELGTCSRTLGYLLNREFDNPNEAAELALAPLAGGILQTGNQCGMLWGSSLAVGAEAYRQCKDLQQGMQLAILGTQNVMAAFSEMEGTTDCRDITRCDFRNKLSFAWYLVSLRFRYCFNMAERFAPKAVEAASIALKNGAPELQTEQINCASETIRRMGGSEEEMVMVAGFAGGMGLTGNACGALGAAIWKRTLDWSRQNPGKSTYNTAVAKEVLRDFLTLTRSRMLCRDLCGKSFSSPMEHSVYMLRGGCDAILKLISKDLQDPGPH